MPSTFPEQEAKDIGKGDHHPDRIRVRVSGGWDIPPGSMAKVKYQQASTFKGGRGDAGGQRSPPRGYWPSWGCGGAGHCSLVFSRLALAGTLRAGRRPVWPHPTPHRGHLSWAEKDPNSPERLSPGSSPELAISGPGPQGPAWTSAL